MQRELGDFMDLVAALEQSAGRLVPQVMEAQILDSQQAAGPRKRGTDTLGVKGEYVFARLGLYGDKRPGLMRVFESPVVPILVGRVLGVPDHARSVPSCRCRAIPDGRSRILAGPRQWRNP